MVCTSKVEKNPRYFVGVFSKTIISLALVGYEMIIANSGKRALFGDLPPHIQQALGEQLLNSWPAMFNLTNKTNLTNVI